MAPPQDVVGHWNKLAFIIGCSTAFRKPASNSWPKDVRLTIDHAANIGTQIIIRLKGNPLAKSRIVFDMSKVILLSPHGSGGRLEQVVELLLLKLIYPLNEAFHLSESWVKDEPGTMGKKGHIFPITTVSPRM